jgi:hypothetical protein
MAYSEAFPAIEGTAMDKIILNPEARSHLNGLDRYAEVCDETGKTLGFFLPPDLHHELIYAWAKTLFNDEELARARADVRANGGYTTAEVLSRLEEVIRQARGKG